MDGPKKEEPALTEREKALLERVDQLEKRLAEVEGRINKPALLKQPRRRRKQA